MFQSSFASTIHLLCEFAAYTVGYQYYRVLRRKQGDVFSESQRLQLLLSTIVGALIGSRLVGVLENPIVNWNLGKLFINVMSNKSIVGGFLGGLAGTELTKWRWKEHRSTGDLLVFPLILGLIIGRVGCFFAGLSDNTHGNPTSLPWAVDYGDGIPRHPAQLYEILFLLLVWRCLILLERRVTLQNGVRFMIFLSSYLFFRLLIEFIKPDPAVALGLSTIQWSCVGGLLYYALIIYRTRPLMIPRTL